MNLRRIKWLDFVKGLCIFMVVAEHSIYFSGTNEYNSNEPEVLLKYLLDVLMLPSFFAISGYLYKPSKTLKKYLLLIYKKVVSFIIPYIIFYLFFAICSSSNMMDFKFNINPIRILLYPNGDLWFLWALFIIFMIVGLMDFLHINKVIQFILFIVLLLIFLVLNLRTNYNIMISLRVQHAILQMSNIIFFLMGELIRKYIKLVKKNGFLIIGLFCLSFIIMIFTPFYYDAQFISLNTLIPKILGIFMMFAIAMTFKHDKIFNYFTKCGKYTLIIYITHYIPLLFIEGILHKLILFAAPLNIILQPILTLLICWIFVVIICYLAERMNVLNWIFYPRKHIDKYFLKTKLGLKLFN